MAALGRWAKVCRPPQAEVTGGLANDRFGEASTAVRAAELGRKPNGGLGWFPARPLFVDNGTTADVTLASALDQLQLPSWRSKDPLFKRHALQNSSS